MKQKVMRKTSPNDNKTIVSSVEDLVNKNEKFKK